MKTQFLKTILLYLIISSCSSDGETDTIDEQPQDIQDIQLIERIQSENPSSFDIGNQFFYDDNDNLTFIYLNDCSGILYHFEYNSSDRISRRYEGSITLTEDMFNPDAFDLNSFKANNSRVLNFIYDGDRLIQMQEDDGFIRFNFQYDSNGNLLIAEQFSPFIDGIWNRVTVQYSGNTISSLNNIEFNTDGSISSDFNYTFEFDTNLNPFYNTSINDGLLSLFTCTGFEYISSIDGGYKIFENNVTEVRRDGELFFTANYQYDENGYPVRISFNDSNGNISGNDIITYRAK